MRKVTIGLVVLGVLALALISMPMRAQNPEYASPGYPPEFSPLRTSRPRPPQRSLGPPTKFARVQNAIPHKYIVVLNDDVVSSSRSLDERRAQVSAIADNLATIHGGQRGFVYETVLKGFSIELPNEAAAVALSKDPQVRWVEEAGVLHLTIDQPTPPWGLDRIDQMDPVGQVTNGITGGFYTYFKTGAGVTAYVIDSGIRTTHVDFGGRASIAADFINPSIDTCVTTTNNDCLGHGTHVAGILGGATYGVAKEVTIRSVKVCTASLYYGCPNEAIIAGVNWVTNDHNANPSVPAVANMSLGGSANYSIDAAVGNSINAGVTYALAAGNDRADAGNFSPAHVVQALTIGASGPTDKTAKSQQGVYFSNYGPYLDLFAPGEQVLSAFIGSDTDTLALDGTSMASPHAAGAVALYLQGRTGASAADCFSIFDPVPNPNLPASYFARISTCSDRVNEFIKSNASLKKLLADSADPGWIGTGSPNRLLFTGSLPTTTNPIDNQRFFIWRQYEDFLGDYPEPNEDGLNYWTGQITGTCNTGFNDNNSCTHGKRIDVSRAFWVYTYPSLVIAGQGVTNNSQFVHLCYTIYLRRNVSDTDPDFQSRLGQLNGYGNPANESGVNYLIDAFTNLPEYRERFGQP
ncbi:MAG: hypothetical protein DMF73_12580 [Acidobacteria bacterium]|nr:MAG: hypothetical protein DMF73_12580 [Acidobacteriota bacterium]